MTDEMQLLDSAAQHAAILETVGEAIISVDGRQRIRVLNRETERTFGYSRDELLGAQIQTLMPKPYREAHERAFNKRIRNGAEGFESPRYELEGLRKNGEVFPLELRFTTVTIDGELLFTGAARDITERIDQIRELEKRNREIEDLRRAIVLERDYLREEVRSNGAYGEIIGRSPSLVAVHEQIADVSATEANVLILGESGVGKELVARAIHDQSPRSARPLVKVNCASIPRDLFESEFFGHVRGAFTGAVRDRAGRFEMANLGTIFLDEVGEIPLELQAKLLRVLEENQFERVGDDQTRHVDVRVIAATNRDLRKEVQSRQFREDLFYRLSVFPILVPPLRERASDVLSLARHLLRQSASELKCPEPGLPEHVGQRLTAYNWPGNVRELKNVMERAVIVSRGRPLTTQMLGLPISTGVLESAEDDPERDETSTDDREDIQRALDQHGGIVSRAADELGLSRQALYRRLKKLGIRRS